jgi:hypothetical protein
MIGWAMLSVALLCGQGCSAPEPTPNIETVSRAVGTPTQVRVRAILQPGAVEATRVPLVSANTSFANPYWAAANIQFAPDQHATTEATFTNCADNTTIGNLGNQFTGVIPLFICETPTGNASSNGPNDILIDSGATRALSHEGGHYFNLAHVFAEGKMFDAGFKTIASNALQPPTTQSQRQGIWNNLIATTFDGDGLADTAPSIQAGIPVAFQDPVADDCAPTYRGKMTFAYTNGTFNGYFSPDRTNIMSYFRYCDGAVPGQYRISPTQIIKIAAYLAGPRRHLLGPALKWSAWSQVAGATARPLGSAAFDSRLYLFTAGNGSNNTIYFNVALAQQPFIGWQPLGGITDAAISATPFDNRLYLFTRGNGTDHNVYFNVALPQQPFIGWQPVGGQTDQAVASTAFDNRLYLFTKGDGADHSIYVNVALPQQPFIGWQPVGGTTDRPLAATSFDNRLYIFAQAAGSNQYTVNVALPQQPFIGWDTIPSELTTGVFPTGALAATSYAGRLIIVARGSNSRLYFNSALPQQPFGSWYEIPGAMLSNAEPTVAVFDNRLYVTIKKSSNQIYVVSAEELLP